MKFLTEMDLRARYGARPFQEFAEEKGQRLTPGGRQYLLDRGVTILPREKTAPAVLPTEPSEGTKEPSAGCPLIAQKKASLQALFLVTLQQVTLENVTLGEQVAELSRCFREIDSPDYTIPQHRGEGCLLAEQGNDSCFEVTEFHMQLAQGAVIGSLHYLRSQLQECWTLLDLTCQLDAPCQREAQQLKERLEPLIYALNPMICHAVGGNICRR